MSDSQTSPVAHRLGRPRGRTVASRGARCSAGLAAMVLAVAACGGGDSGGATSGSGLTSMLQTVPDVVVADGDNGLMLTFVDFEAASAFAGVQTPGASASQEVVEDWAFGLFTASDADTDPRLIVPGLNVIGQFAFLGADDVRADTGIGLGGLSAVLEVAAGIEGLAVLTGDIELGGTLDDLGDGIRSLGTGEDNEVSPENRDGLRPLGRPLRFTEVDGAIVMTRSTPAAQAARSGAPSLADDGGIGALAAAIDRDGLYAAVIARGDFSAANNFVLIDLGLSAAEAGVAEVAPFRDVAIGHLVIDGRSSAIVAYAFADDAAAAAAVEPLESMWRTGVDFDTGEPLADFFQVTGAEVDGSIVSVSMSLTDDGPSPLRMLSRLAVPFVHP